MMGRICVETADKFLNGGDTSEHILLELGIARAEEIDEFKFKE